MSESVDRAATAPAAEAAPLVCEADVVQLDLPQEQDEDPFNAVLQLGGLHHSGVEMVVWLRLTPTTIGPLLTQLQQLLHEQQAALGLPATESTDTREGNDEPDVSSAAAQEGRVRRFLDPLGIRHLRDRSPRSTVIMAGAIAALMLLAFIVQLVRG